MQLNCLTDEGPILITPSKEVEKAPFHATRNLETVQKMISGFRLGTPLFPINPRLPLPSKLPEKKCATFLYTSGSSGTPKIACHSLENYEYSARGTNECLQLCEEDRWLLSVPLFHVGGIAILFRCAIANATVVLSDLPLLDAILFHRITHVSLVPTQLYRLMQEEETRIRMAALQLRSVLLGGAPIPHSLLTKALQFGFKLNPTYGLTEMTSQVTMEPFATPLPYREMKLAPDGEILVRGKTLFLGYLNSPPQEGWFATRDLGHMTKEGKFEVIGRKDNLFISGGENIQPEEIEEALLHLPGIAEAIVIPQPDPEFGARPVAFIYDETKRATLESIREQLKGKISSFKMPIALYPLPPVEMGLKRSRKQCAELLRDRN
jgi:O-succinylbenzoic acid--CoA ligase